MRLVGAFFSCSLAVIASTLNAQAAGNHCVFYLEDSRLIVLGLDLRSGQQSLASAWKEAVGRYYSLHDVDTNGAIQGDELATLPSADELQQMLRLPVSDSAPRFADYRPRDGKVTPFEFSSWLKLIGAGPFTVRGASPRNARRQSADVDLFAELDENGDKRLTADEVTRRINHLKRFDIDDDESLSVRELRPFDPGPQIMRTEAQPPASASVSLLAATSSTERRILVGALLDHFDGKKKPGERDGKLSRDELGLDSAVFSSHDIDHDGHLDYEELGQFVRRPVASVSYVAQLEKVPSTTEQISISGNTRLAEQAGLQIDVQSPGKADDNEWKRQFSEADADGNAYLDADEIDRFVPVRGQLRLLDNNGDGMVLMEEWTRFARKRSLLSRVCVVLSVERGGADLFEIIDSNDDGRLSFRELSQSAPRLIQANAGSETAGAAKGYRLTIAPIALAEVREGVSIEPSSSGTPSWFDRMDRNRDGEVTIREFTGPLSRFGRLDLNGDDTISRIEAGQSL